MLGTHPSEQILHGAADLPHVAIRQKGGHKCYDLLIPGVLVIMHKLKRVESEEFPMVVLGVHAIEKIRRRSHVFYISTQFLIVKGQREALDLKR
jgi:hypothetical protein